jgi:hypothetical protein
VLISVLCTFCAKLQFSFFIANPYNLIIGYWADKQVSPFTKQALLYGCTKSTVLSKNYFVRNMENPVLAQTQFLLQLSSLSSARWLSVIFWFYFS